MFGEWVNGLSKSVRSSAIWCDVVRFSAMGKTGRTKVADAGAELVNFLERPNTLWWYRNSEGGWALEVAGANDPKTIVRSSAVSGSLHRRFPSTSFLRS